MPPVARYWAGTPQQLEFMEAIPHIAESAGLSTVKIVPTMVCRAYEATIEDVSKADRSIVAKINTGDVDRYRTVISPDGIDLKGYRANPVVLWEHGKDPQRGSMPIGRNLWIKNNGSGNGMLVAKTLFGKDTYSQSLFDMYEDGTLRGWSVNILPDSKMCSPPTKEEMRARPELADCTMMYRGGELAEYSGVAVPGNAETLSILAERGIWCPSVVNSVESKEIPEKTKAVEKKWKAKRIVPKPEQHKDGSFRGITQSNGVYQVHVGLQKILETPDRSVAELTLASIDSPSRAWESELVRLFASQQKWQEQMTENTRALTELIRDGRV